MKKKFLILSMIILTFFLTSCFNKNTLMILNWGEYISTDLIEKFEKKYNVNINLSLADSNEYFYSKLKTPTTVYDIVFPSDYMVLKMIKNDLLSPIDFNKLTNYRNDMFVSTVNDIIDKMNIFNKDSYNYFIPYFWGNFGIMYNTKNTNNILSKLENKYEIFFNKDLNKNLKIGLYDVARYTYSLPLLYKEVNINEESMDNIYLSKNLLNSVNAFAFGTDNLKKMIATDNLDLSFLWTGDYIDMIFESINSNSNINFSHIVPKNTINFLDTMVIPKKSKNKNLAHKFIDFMLDENNSYLNSSNIGYCTPYKITYDKIINYKGDSKKLIAWKELTKHYYDIKVSISNILYPFDRKFNNEVNVLFNSLKK